MFIDTHTRISMETSICKYLDITINELKNIFEKAGCAAQSELFFDGGKFDKIINAFIDKKTPKDKPIDQILFFHLGRRLNVQQSCNAGDNLHDLLSSKNALTSFLKEHDVEFKSSNG